MLALLATLAVATAVAHPPIASVAEAQALVAADVLVLDARGRAEYRAGHVPGAVRIDWEDFRDGWGRTGRLSDDDAGLSKALGALGVDDAREVLVYGKSSRGFGEEGRIAWMLSYLGHARVYVLDGGLEAWRGANGAIEVGGGKPPRPGKLRIRRQPALRAELTEVERLLKDRTATVLDVRTPEEWNGGRPYLEARGGHLPGARHLSWTAFFDDTGRLREARELAALLVARGVERERPVVVYCTGGVRSALVWAVLVRLGYDARNFDGSFWAWAARKELPVAVGGPP